MLNGKKFYFAGTNAFYAGSTDAASDDDVQTLFKMQSANGAKVVRTWGFVNGYGYGQGAISPTPNPIQPSPGKNSHAELLWPHHCSVSIPCCKTHVESIVASV